MLNSMLNVMNLKYYIKTKIEMSIFLQVYCYNLMLQVDIRVWISDQNEKAPLDGTLSQVCRIHVVFTHRHLKPIFHSDAKPFSLGPRAG